MPRKPGWRAEAEAAFLMRERQSLTVTQDEVINDEVIISSAQGLARARGKFHPLKRNAVPSAWQCTLASLQQIQNHWLSANIYTGQPARVTVTLHLILLGRV